jgi:chemotaxis protein methyltransferase CheR
MDEPADHEAGERFKRITEQEYSRLCEFLYRRTGMVFTETKRYYVERRVRDRMKATEATSFASYFARLRIDASGEVEQFVNAFTINETYFYREQHQLRCLTADLLRERIADSRRDRITDLPRDRVADFPRERVDDLPRDGVADLPRDGVATPRLDSPIRIWSLPCSTGEEPYSIALWLLENWPPVDAYDIEIVGSDIDTTVLQAAEAGVFGKRALTHLPPAVVARYFAAIGNEEWRIIDDLRQSVRFAPVNLIDAASTAAFGRFDVIFCRNLLIYFDDASRRVAAENLFESLRPRGFLCLGHSESMSRISPLFEVRRFADAIVYQRPLPG